MRIIFVAFLFIFCTGISSAQYRGGSNATSAHAIKLSNTTCTVINVNPFKGGSADGESYVRLINVTCPSINTNPFSGGVSSSADHPLLVNITCPVFNTNPFLGGTGDGEDKAILVNISCPVINANPFLGGNGDGEDHSVLNNITCPVVNVNPFMGGINDGADKLLLQNISCPVINVNPFAGGSGDGHSNREFINITCPVINVNPFYGGDGDGHSNKRLINITCPTVNTNPYSGGTATGASQVKLTNINCGTLPIEMLPLFAVREGDHINLYWSTVSEVNNDHFNLEKSSDGEEFFSFNTVAGHGNSTQLIRYRSVDEEPYEGLSFYRVKQIDFDGNFSYSNIVRVNYHPVELNMFPNPLTDDRKITVQCDVEKNDRLVVSFDNPLGSKIYENTFDVQRGSNTLELDLPALANGIYLAHLRYGQDDEMVIRLIVNK